MRAPSTFSVRPSEFCRSDDLKIIEVVRTIIESDQRTSSDVWRLTGPELLALVDVITASDAWQRAVREAGGEVNTP